MLNMSNVERLQYNLSKGYGDVVVICGDLTFTKTYGSYYIEGEGFIRSRIPYKTGGHICTVYYVINDKKRLYMIPIDSKNTNKKEDSCQYCNIDNLIQIFAYIYNILQMKVRNYKEELLVSLAKYYNPNTRLTAIEAIASAQDQENTIIKFINNIFNETERDLRDNAPALFRLRPRAEDEDNDNDNDNSSNK